MFELILMFVSLVLIIVAGWFSYRAKLNDIKKNGGKKNIASWIFTVVILGALLGLCSNFYSYKLKQESDSVAVRNQRKADSNQAKAEKNQAKAEKNQDKLDSVTRLIFKLQNQTIDSAKLIISYNRDLRTVQGKVVALQEEAFRYVSGSGEVPALTASISGEEVLISITNPDSKYAMYNVRAKKIETFYPDIGTLYPRASRILERFNISPGKLEGWYFVVWYNNNKSVTTYIDLFRDSKGYLAQNVKYINELGQEFIPPWKKRAIIYNKKHMVYKGHPYNPSLSY